jgi:hypothetical protein
VPLRSPRPRHAIGFVVAPWLRRDTLFALGAADVLCAGEIKFISREKNKDAGGGKKKRFVRCESAWSWLRTLCDFF